LSAVGTSGSEQVIYYAEVDGGGIETELIEVIELPVKEAKTFMYDESVGKTVGLMFAFMWWFSRFGNTEH